MNSTIGKKHFKGLRNMSDKKNMYPVLTNDKGGKELFFRRQKVDYDRKFGIEYKPPPVTKEFQKKTSFVHNCIANKNKSNISHFENIYNNKVFNRHKYKILRVLHENKVDFRKMTMLKNELFESEDLEDNHLVPLSVWKESLGIMGGDLDCCENMILDEIR